MGARRRRGVLYQSTHSRVAYSTASKERHGPRPCARRTRRLCEAQARVGRACGGAGGARLLAHLQMPASRATVLRLVTRMPMPDTQIPSGSASTTGRSGRAAVTARSSSTSTVTRVVDLLLDRTAPTVAGWLERHPGVELVAGIARRSMPEVQASRHSPGAAGRRSMAPAHQHAAGRRALASRGPCPVAEPSTPPWLDRSSRPTRPRLCPLYDGVGSGCTEPDAMAGCLRRGPPPACRRGAPARDRPCHGSGACDGAQVCERRDVPARLPHGAGPSLLIRTSRTWRGGSTRAARTPSPCGARSGSRATRGRAGRCIASSPSAGRGGPIGPQGP